MLSLVDFEEALVVFGGEGAPLPGSRPQGAQLSEQSSPHIPPCSGALNNVQTAKLSALSLMDKL